MKLMKLWHKYSDNLSKDEILVIGFHYILLWVMIIAMFLDYIIGNLIDASFELSFTIIILLSMISYKYTNNIIIARSFVLLVSTVGSYIFLYTNQFGISVYHIIIPLGYFLLLNFKKAIIYTLIHQSIIIIMYVHAYNTFSELHTLPNDAQLVSIAIASFLIVLFGIIYHLAIEEYYRKLKVADRLKEILLHEVHHRVKNNLNIISSMLGMQMHREKEERIKKVFQKNRLRIDAIAMIHEILYSQSNFESINIYDYLYQLSTMIIEMSDITVKINIEKKILHLPFEMVLNIGIITNEIILNSIKHSFINNKREITIIFEEKEANYIYQYYDNNTNYIDIKILNESNTLGFKLITLMVEQIEATMRLSGANGLVYNLEIPKNVS